METLENSSEKPSTHFGWVLVLIVAILQALSSFFLLFGNSVETFEVDTGIAWTELIEVFPTVATQVEMSQQSSTAGSLVIGLMSIAIILFALRKGDVWAWFTMWLMPLFMLPGTISLAQSDNPAWVAVMGGGLILLAALGLLISFPTSILDRNSVPRDQVGGEGQTK
ncbi:MAG TPA: hypothetical protein VMN57_04500 [Anaerolineales bacterium]|nr:hypothetical protein [Anaerolineales bacterium]